MKFTVAQIASLLEGQVEGDPETEIYALAKIEEGHTGALSFLANPKYLPFIYTTQSSVVLVAEDFVPEQTISTNLIRVKDPYSAFTKLLELVQMYLNQPAFKGISDKAHIEEGVELGEGVCLGPYVYVGKGSKIGNNTVVYPGSFIGSEVQIGADSILYPNVTVYTRCQVGNNCILHAGCVIGSDGFGFAPQPDGSFVKIPQTGIVQIEDEVEIGANTCIDRATLGATIIKKGAKIDNLVQLAHNVEVGNNTGIAAQSGVSGSTKIGAYCLIGGQVGFAGHLSIANRTSIGAQSGISADIKTEGMQLRGSPARELRKQLRAEASLRNLESYIRKINELEQRLSELERRRAE